MLAVIQAIGVAILNPQALRRAQLVVLLRHGVLEGLLVGNRHPLVPLRGPGLEAFDHLERIAVAGWFGIALVAGNSYRRRQTNRGDRDQHPQHGAHLVAHAGGISPSRLAMILSIIRLGRIAVIRCRIGSGVIW
jgi:hypothetical protein